MARDSGKPQEGAMTMSSPKYAPLAEELVSLLSLSSPPLAITFSQEAPEDVAPYDGPMAEPTPDGRTGRVPAGCVFWVKAMDHTFTTVPEDHANCSVGSMTHGLKTLEEVADKSDVATLVGSGWVSPEIFPQIPTVKQRPDYISYGPLHETPVDPDVVFIRVNAKQAMVLSDAFPELRFEGKPQCHIIAIAKEQEQVAVSVGCMLSRVRTGIPNTEMTCAIPAGRLAEVLDRLKGTCGIDGSVAAYASEDAQRFRA
jgi:uncharacterized protein (DUF169 family)